MSVELSYMDAVELVRKAYGDGSLTWSETSTALANAGYTTENYLEFFENSSGVFNVVKNADGSIRNLTWNTAEVLESNSITGAIDSNVQTSLLSEGAEVGIPSELTIQSGATQGTFSAGVSQVGNFVFKEVAPAVGATMVGCALGKFIDGAVYNIGDALGLDPPWELNPENWGGLVSDIDETDPLYVQWGGKALQFLLGIDDNTSEMQAYLDEDAVLNFGLWLQEQGMFSSPTDITPTYDYDSFLASQGTSPSDFPNIVHLIGLPKYINSETYTFTNNTKPVYAMALSGNPSATRPGIVLLCSEANFTPLVNGNSRSTATITALGKTYYYSNLGNWGSVWDSDIPASSINYKPGSGGNLNWWYWCYADAACTGSGGIPGTSDQPGATIPIDVIWESPQDVKDWLDTNMPGWDSNAVTNTVPQPDGTTKTYKYVKVPYPVYNDETETNPSTGDSTQQNPKIDPVTYPYPETLIRNITTPITPPSWPDTGTGTTPTITPPVGTSGALFGIYNPSQAELDSFGAWLWSSNFIDQLLKIFNDPMQAIIGLHKVFVIPAVKLQTQHIMVGYLDSGVDSHVVSRQYETVDCGTINLKEYFGNVFDYDPHTTVSIYLPFIGIQQLRTGDVMRSKIKVLYHVDVITGACLVEVKVTRDNAGGTLYTYTGNCAVQYPLSSGSYMGIVASLASIAGGIIGTVATGGAAAPLAVGAISGALNAHTNVSRSGGFSGNAGAMGIKRPYLIITRPQTNLADFEGYQGYPANKTVQLSDCRGYVKCKECHLENLTATGDELQEIDNLLKSGILI